MIQLNIYVTNIKNIIIILYTLGNINQNSKIFCYNKLRYSI